MTTNANMDSITGDPKKGINRLAFPMMASLLLMVLNNVVDSAWVAGLGSVALAAVGFVTPLYLALVGFGNGIGAGANSLISRYIGSKNYKQANNSVIHGILLSVFISIILTVVIFIFLEDLLIAMGASEVLNEAMDYAVVIVLGIFTIFIQSMFSAIFRAEGNVRRSTIPLVVTAVLNMILDPIFIYTFGWGVGGAAIATILSAFIGLLISLYWIFVKKDSYFEIKKENFKNNLKIYKNILTVGIPASIEEFIMSIVLVIINWLVLMNAATTGTAEVAAFTAGWRIISIGIIPAMGVGIATVTVAGIAFGAKNYENLKTTVFYSAKLGFIISLIAAILIYIFSNEIAYIFAYSASSSELLPLTSEVIRTLSVFIIPIAFGGAAAYTFQGVGKGLFSLILTFLRELVFTVIFAYVLSLIFHMGEVGVYWGMNLGGIVGSAIAFICILLYLLSIKRKWLEDS